MYAGGSRRGMGPSRVPLGMVGGDGDGDGGHLKR
jgi:hypothetical protein